MSITYAGMIGPSLDGVGSPATFTTDTLVTANTNASAKMIVFRGWAVSTGGTSTMAAALSSAQPTFTSACFNPVGGTPCYGTVPIYPLDNSGISDGTPGPGFFFAAAVIPLVDVAIGSTFSLTPTPNPASLIYAVGELYTGTVQPPGATAGTTWNGTSATSSGVVIGTDLVMTNTTAIGADSSMALTFQYTDNSTTCCVECGSINALFASGDAAADGTWDCGNTDQTWTDTFGAVYQGCRECTGYAPNRFRDYQVLLGHDTVTPSGTYVLTGQATTPNGANQCIVGGNPDTRPRTGQRQTVFCLRDHDPLACCPGTPPPFVGLQGELSFQATDQVVLGPGSIPPQLTSGAAMGKISFER